MLDSTISMDPDSFFHKIEKTSSRRDFAKPLIARTDTSHRVDIQRSARSKIRSWDRRAARRVLSRHYYSSKPCAREKATYIHIGASKPAAISLLHARCDRTRYAASAIVRDPGPGINSREASTNNERRALPILTPSVPITRHPKNRGNWMRFSKSCTIRCKIGLLGHVWRTEFEYICLFAGS